MIFIIQSDPEVPPGLIADELQGMHVDWQLIRLDGGERLSVLQRGDKVIVLGGKMSANDDRLFPFLVQLKLWIRDAVEKNIPYMGICLGAQLLAAALGAKVIGNRWGERGNCQVSLTEGGIDDPLFNGLPGELVAFQWHDDSFDLPVGVTLMASSDVCPHQAFHIGAAWGLQFHPEVTPEIISEWASEKPEVAAGFIAEWQERESTYRAAAHIIMKNFLGT